MGSFAEGLEPIGDYDDTFSASCDRGYVNSRRNAVFAQTFSSYNGNDTVATREQETRPRLDGRKPELQRRMEQWRHSDHRTAVRRYDRPSGDGDGQRLAVWLRPAASTTTSTAATHRFADCKISLTRPLIQPLLLSRGRLVVVQRSAAIADRRTPKCARRSARTTDPKPGTAPRARCHRVARAAPEEWARR